MNPSPHNATPSVPLQHQLNELSHFAHLLNEARANADLPDAELQRKISEGRERQVTLSAAVVAARLEKSNTLENLLAERRLAHISTILARAEMLARDTMPSVSKYTGDEGKFDDLSVLERAKFFMNTESYQELDADARLDLMYFAERFAAGEQAVQAKEY